MFSNIMERILAKKFFEDSLKNSSTKHIKQYYTTAIKAIELTIPKKFNIDNTGMVKCPNCNLYIRLPIADHYNNCPECGQAIKWNDEDE